MFTSPNRAACAIVATLVAIVCATNLHAEPKEERVDTQIEALQVESVLPGSPYGILELRHHVNTYYDEKGYRDQQIPAMHARAKIGAVFREGLIDAYATLGLIKKTSTQQIQQRRPEFEVDVYPIEGRYGRIVQYSIFQLPHRADDDRETQEDEPTAVQKQGTTFTFGLAPTLVYPMDLNGTVLKLKSGVDAWTKFFSERQFQEDDELKEDKFATAPAENEDQPVEEREDVAQRYYTKYMVGSSLSPAWWQASRFDLAMFYDIDYVPQYETNADGSEDYKYIAEKSSYYRFRTRINLTARTSVVNDFYHFHSGFFEKKRKGEERRFRNVARLSYKL